MSSTPSRRTFLKTLAAVSSSASPSSMFAASAHPAGTQSSESKTDVLIIGGSLGGIAAALAAARMGSNVIVTEETSWIGGQATGQGVPLDEHPWIERYGRTQSYADFRSGVRDYYRRHYPLTPEARADRCLNPGAGWVSGLCFEPHVGLAVLNEMLAPHLASGRIIILTRHRPVALHMERDSARAVTVLDETNDVKRTFTAPFILDATE
ncbi:MAG: FAD-dependent oxidoreductase, partial [Akkermansiaceae bacterium]|nr:FAD-dependent oxidoreductase [Akkermansiaceae bacterium]